MNYKEWTREVETAGNAIVNTYGVNVRIEEYSGDDYEGIKVDGMEPWQALVYGTALCEAAFRARTIEGYPTE